MISNASVAARLDAVVCWAQKNAPAPAVFLLMATHNRIIRQWSQLPFPHRVMSRLFFLFVFLEILYSNAMQIAFVLVLASNRLFPISLHKVIENKNPFFCYYFSINDVCSSHCFVVSRTQFDRDRFNREKKNSKVSTETAAVWNSRGGGKWLLHQLPVLLSPVDIHLP